MGQIKINYSEAKEDIEALQAQVDNNITSIMIQLDQLSAILNESEGEFIQALNEQLLAEKEVVSVSEDFFRKLYQVLLNAVDTYDEQDKKVSMAFGNTIWEE